MTKKTSGNTSSLERSLSEHLQRIKPLYVEQRQNESVLEHYERLYEQAKLAVQDGKQTIGLEDNRLNEEFFIHFKSVIADLARRDQLLQGAIDENLDNDLIKADDEELIYTYENAGAKAIKDALQSSYEKAAHRQELRKVYSSVLEIPVWITEAQKHSLAVVVPVDASRSDEGLYKAIKEHIFNAVLSAGVKEHSVEQHQGVYFVQINYRAFGEDELSSESYNVFLKSLAQLPDGFKEKNLAVNLIDAIAMQNLLMSEVEGLAAQSSVRDDVRSDAKAGTNIPIPCDIDPSIVSHYGNVSDLVNGLTSLKSDDPSALAVADLSLKPANVGEYVLQGKKFYVPINKVPNRFGVSRSYFVVSTTACQVDLKKIKVNGEPVQCVGVQSAVDYLTSKGRDHSFVNLETAVREFQDAYGAWFPKDEIDHSSRITRMVNSGDLPVFFVGGEDRSVYFASISLVSNLIVEKLAWDYVKSQQAVPAKSTASLLHMEEEEVRVKVSDEDMISKRILLKFLDTHNFNGRWYKSSWKKGKPGKRK